MTFPADYGNSVLRFSGHVLGWFAVAYIYENVVEYVWHRAMHLPWCYRTMHKYHHTYKAPEPFDDLYIHPLEAAGYYCILHSPAFLFPQPLWSYLLYMAWMGATGVLDHSGVKLELPFDIYDTEAHGASSSEDCQLPNMTFWLPSAFLSNFWVFPQTCIIQRRPSTLASRTYSWTCCAGPTLGRFSEWNSMPWRHEAVQSVHSG